ncbi:PepSY-associated TM helix domain-containing protein [Nannocystis sp. ILAH1]|uniref:PepSY-associated TM helix domain-containing protein n=1 Tax=Nannocystis sp. ILAH1 TaxID=2996789 RepID=UPI00226FF357|nr:PepSY-associated TM helix domain-containing protein [Nannocystis sp. ILAH1]MCY0990259.1 PepSY-associated TM helix domain-containing protein [Nannocystis sp. ILAH1]
MSMRRGLFKWHQAVGATLSAVFAVIALTGAILVFRGCMKTPPPSAPVVEQPLPLMEILARAQREAGDEAITDIGLATEPDEPWVFWVDDDDETVLYFAGDGALIERRRTAGGLTQLLFKLHTGEIIGLPGQAVALAAGLGMLALVATGLGMIVSRRRPRG